MMIAIILWLIAGGVYLWAFSNTEISFDMAKYHFDKSRNDQQYGKNVFFLKNYKGLSVDKFHKLKWFGVITHSPVGVIVAMCHLAQVIDAIYTQNRD